MPLPRSIPEFPLDLHPAGTAITCLISSANWITPRKAWFCQITGDSRKRSSLGRATATAVSFQLKHNRRGRAGMRPYGGLAGHNSRDLFANCAAKTGQLLVIGVRTESFPRTGGPTRYEMNNAISTPPGLGIQNSCVSL